MVVATGLKTSLVSCLRYSYLEKAGKVSILYQLLFSYLRQFFFGVHVSMLTQALSVFLLNYLFLIIKCSAFAEVST